MSIDSIVLLSVSVRGVLGVFGVIALSIWILDEYRMLKLASEERKESARGDKDSGVDGSGVRRTYPVWFTGVDDGVFVLFGVSLGRVSEKGGS